MSKTVKVAGLHSVLAWLAPLCESIVGNSVQVADGVAVNLPDDTTFTFSPGPTPDITHVTFSGISVSIDRRSLMGLIHVSATEPVTFADIGPQSIENQVSLFRIVAVDEGT